MHRIDERLHKGFHLRGASAGKHFKAAASYSQDAPSNILVLLVGNMLERHTLPQGGGRDGFRRGGLVDRAEEIGIPRSLGDGAQRIEGRWRGGGTVLEEEQAAFQCPL